MSDKREQWIFRVASTPEEGGGHMMRCISLALTLRDKARVLFILCSGSLVCSHYANMFNDGTKIKFINNPNVDNEVIYNINSKECEEHIRNKLNINKHSTPGIKPGYENEKKCNFSIYENTKKI